jgi:hypothetical protein
MLIIDFFPFGIWLSTTIIHQTCICKRVIWWKLNVGDYQVIHQVTPYWKWICSMTTQLILFYIYCGFANDLKTWKLVSETWESSLVQILIYLLSLYVNDLAHEQCGLSHDCCK